MQDEIVSLAKLAAMDESARAFDLELSELPADIENKRQGVGTLEALLERERDQLAEASSLRSQRQDELKASTDGLARAKAKMARATNLRESDAAEREVEANRRSIKEREEEIIRITAIIEEKGSSLAEREKGFEEARSAFVEEEGAASGRLAHVAEERGKILEGRDEIVAKISKRSMKRYDRVRKTKGDGVVIVESGTCTGCRMALPAQLYIDVQRGEEIIDCPQCRRIVLYRPLVGEDIG